MKIGIKTKLVNHNFLQAIMDTGVNSVNAFCIKHNFSPSMIGEFVNLKKTPYTKELCKRLEKSLKVSIDILFPNDLIQQVQTKPQTRFYFEREMEMIPLEYCSTKELSYIPNIDNEDDRLDKALSLLSPKEEHVLRAHYGLNEDEKNYKEIGHDLNIGRQRVHQIKAKALQKLRGNVKFKKLKLQEQ